MIPHETILQYGFAGVCLVLIGVLCWIIKLFLACVRGFQRALTANTAAIVALTGRQADVERNLREIRDETLRHGCPFAPPSAQQSGNRQLVGT